MKLIAVLAIDWEAVGHWSTLAQGVFAFLTFLATVVYVYFTFHIMRWAVGQGKAAVRVAEFTVAGHENSYYHLLVMIRERLSIGRLFVQMHENESLAERIGWAFAVYKDAADELGTVTKNGGVPLAMIPALERWCTDHEFMRWLSKNLSGYGDGAAEKKLDDFLVDCGGILAWANSEFSRITAGSVRL